MPAQSKQTELQQATAATKAITKAVSQLLTVRRKEGTKMTAEKKDQALAWCAALQEPIEKRYLKTAALGFLDNWGAALESYTFRLEYPCSETIVLRMEQQKKNRETPVDFTEDIDFFTGQCHPLSSDARYVNMQLTFTRLTPPNYSPSQFVSCELNEFASFAPGIDVQAILVGEAAPSDMHRLRLMYKGPPLLIPDETPAPVVSTLEHETADDDATDVSSVKKPPYKRQRPPSPVNQVSSQDSTNDWPTFSRRVQSKCDRLVGL